MTDEPNDPTLRIPLPGSGEAPDSPTTDPASTPSPFGAPPPPPPPPPAWTHHRRRGGDPARTSSILFGLIVLGIGIWFFASETLGLDMPVIRWREAWPVILILVGAWLVLGTLRRRS